MALTFRVWLAAAVCACALIWAGLSRHHFERKPTSNVPWNTLGSWDPSRVAPSVIAEGHLEEANDRLRLLQLRDSIGVLAARRGAPFSVFVDPRFTAPAGASIDSLVLAQWRTLNVTPVVPVAVAVIDDDDFTPGGLPRRRGDSTAEHPSTFFCRARRRMVVASRCSTSR